MAYPVHIANSAVISVPGYGNPAKTIPWPAGIQNGDLVILSGIIEGGSYTLALTGGFTLIQRNGQSQFIGEAYTAWKIYQTGDTAPTVHPGTTYSSYWASSIFRGVDIAAPIEASRQSRGAATGGTVSISANTSTVAEALQVVVIGNTDGSTAVLTPNSPLAEVLAESTGAFPFAVYTAEGPVSAGTVSAKSVASSRTNNHGRVDFLIKPAASGGTTPTGTVTIGTITPNSTGASVPFTYSAADQTGFEYQLNETGTIYAIAASPATPTGLTSSTAYTIRVRAKNASGDGAWSTSAPFTTSAAVVSITFTGTIPTQTFTSGQAVNVDLSTYFSGTQTPFSFARTGTALTGTGLSISSAGVLNGAATTGSVTGVTVTGTDAASNTAVSNAFNVTVNAAVVPVAFGGTIPAITGTQNAAITPVNTSTYFSGSLTPFTYSLFSGPLPAGVTLNSSTGVISGTPTVSFSGNIVVRATDSGGNTANSNSIAVTISVVTATFITGVLRKMVGGSILANTALTYFRLYNPTTGALVLNRTDLSTDANGRVTCIDAAITAGVEYKADWLAATGETRMSKKAAT